MNGAGLFLGVWILFWSSFTLGFDFMVARRVVAQVAATRYTPVTGRVVASRVDGHGGEDSSYRPWVHYSYEVAGRRYESTVHSFHEMGTSDRVYASAVVAAHRPGRDVTVYVDPADPARALLAPGLSGMDLLFWLFMTPFNVVMLGGWEYLRRTLWPVGPEVIERAHQTRVRVPPVGALDCAAVALMGFAILAVFTVMLGFTMHPSVGWMLVVWAIVLGATGATYLQVRSGAVEGLYDIVLDRAAGTVTLPAVLERTAPTIEPFSNVRGATTVRHQTTDSEGDAMVRWRTCVAIGPAGNERLVPVAEWTEERSAAELTDWLQERLKK